MTKIALISDIHVGKFGRGEEFAVNGELNQDTVKGAAPLIDVKWILESRQKFIEFKLYIQLQAQLVGAAPV
jgi:hypothetical protein